MRWRGCATLPAQAGHVAQSGLLGLPRVLEQMPVERIEGMAGGEEPETAAVAYDQASLHGNPCRLRSDLDDVIVRHSAPVADLSRRPHRSLIWLASGAISRVAGDTRRSPPIDGGRKSALARPETRNKTSWDALLLRLRTPRRRFRGALALGTAGQAAPSNPRGPADYDTASAIDISL